MVLDLQHGQQGSRGHQTCRSGLAALPNNSLMQAHYGRDGVPGCATGHELIYSERKTQQHYYYYYYYYCCCYCCSCCFLPIIRSQHVGCYYGLVSQIKLRINLIGQRPQLILICTDVILQHLGWDGRLLLSL